MTPATYIIISNVLRLCLNQKYHFILNSDLKEKMQH